MTTIVQTLSKVGSVIMNPTFLVAPENDLQGSLKKFDWHEKSIETKKLCFAVETNKDSKWIKLVKCIPAKTDQTLREIDKRGFIPMPSPYLLGLGIQHQAAVKKYRLIVSLDEENLLPNVYGPCFLCLCYENEKFGPGLIQKDGIGNNGEFCEDWWFAVINKFHPF